MMVRRECRVLVCDQKDPRAGRIELQICSGGAAEACDRGVAVVINVKRKGESGRLEARMKNEAEQAAVVATVDTIAEIQHGRRGNAAAFGIEREYATVEQHDQET